MRKKMSTFVTLNCKILKPLPQIGVTLSYLCRKITETWTTTEAKTWKTITMPFWILSYIGVWNGIGRD